MGLRAHCKSGSESHMAYPHGLPRGLWAYLTCMTHGP